MRFHYSVSSTLIKVENLSREYRLGSVGTGTIAQDINRVWHKARGKEDPYLKLVEDNNCAIMNRVLRIPRHDN